MAGSPRTSRFVPLFLGILAVATILHHFSQGPGYQGVTFTIKMQPHASDDDKDESYLNKLHGVRDTANVKKPYRPRIMCMIFCRPADFLPKCVTINSTWAQRCDIYRFFISGGAVLQKRFPNVVVMPVKEGHGHLTGKTMWAVKYSYDNFRNETDWFVKADDDVYIVMENLRWVLSFYDPSLPNYIGCRKTTHVNPGGYNSGGASYSLSLASAKLLAYEGPTHYPGICKTDGAIEDIDIGKCLAKFDVVPIDTRDMDRRFIFHPINLFELLSGREGTYSYKKNSVEIHNYTKNLRVLSPYTVSLHRLNPSQMLICDFFLYDIQRKLEFMLPDSTQKDIRRDEMQLSFKPKDMDLKARLRLEES